MKPLSIAPLCVVQMPVSFLYFLWSLYNRQRFHGTIRISLKGLREGGILDPNSFLIMVRCIITKLQHFGGPCYAPAIIRLHNSFVANNTTYKIPPSWHIKLTELWLSKALIRNRMHSSQEALNTVTFNATLLLKKNNLSVNTLMSLPTPTVCDSDL